MRKRILVLFLVFCMILPLAPIMQTPATAAVALPTGLTNDTTYPWSYSGTTIQSSSQPNSTSSTVTAVASNSASFTISYQVSSESGYDFLKIAKNGTNLTSVSGTGAGWKTLSISVSSGDRLTFTYSKDSSVSHGSDCAWVDLSGFLNAMNTAATPAAGVTIAREGAYTVFNSGTTSTSSTTNSNPASLTNGGKNIYYTYSQGGGVLGVTFYVSGTVTERSVVTINAFDVDESSGEVDAIYLKDVQTGTQTRLGKLSGRNQEWNTTTLEIPANLLVAGHTYQLVLTPEVSGWVVWIQTVTLQVGAMQEVVDPNVKWINASGAYTVFNSGSTSTSSIVNPAPDTLTNNGYNLYYEYGGGSYPRTGPIGMPFKISGTVTELSSVTLNAFDVDESSGEVDAVYLKDLQTGTQTRLGKLSGRDREWNTTTLQIAPGLLVDGHTYQLILNCEVSGWVVWVKTATLQIGSMDTPTPTPPVQDSLSLDLHASITNGTISANLTVSATQANNYQVEFKATHVATENQLGSLFTSLSAAAGTNAKNYTFSLENGAPSGTYRIDVYLKDAGGNVLKTVSTTAGWDASTVSYHANGGSQNLPNDTTAYRSGNTVTVKFDYLPSRSGYTFLGWATSSTATVPQYTQNGLKTFTIGANDVHLYAVWQSNAVHTHAYNTVVERNNATCTRDGYLVRACACGDRIIEVLDATGHNWIEDRRLDATCTAQGKIYYRCDLCNGRTTEIIPANGHAWGPNAQYVEPTCTADGYWIVTCTVCEVVSALQDSGTALGHDYGAGVVITPATCTATGTMRYVCTRCPHVKEEVIPTLQGHFMDWSVITEANCEQDGLRHGKCSSCGHEIDEVIPATGHAYTYTDDGNGTTHTVGCEYCVYHLQEAHRGGMKTCLCGYVNPHFVSVLLIQDSLPWSTNANRILFDGLVRDGYIDGWEACTTQQFASIDASQYAAIVFANDQSDATYRAYSQIKPQLESYVQNGGALVFGACWHGWRGGELTDTLLGGVGTVLDFDYTNRLATATHPIVTGSLTGSPALVDNDLRSTYTSHIYFTNLPAGSTVLFKNEAGKPTLVEYPYGQGTVIASGLTWEYSTVYCSYSYFAEKAMDDMVVYALTQSKQLPAEDIFTITYQDPDGNTLYVERVVAGADAAANVDTAKEGYTFTGWDDPTALTNVRANAVVKATYTINEYEVTVSCDSNRGNVYGDGTFEYGEKTVLTMTPKAGWEFTGWYINGIKVSEDEIFVYTVGASDVTVEARFGNYYCADGTVTVETKTAGAGEVVEIRVLLTNNPGLVGVKLNLTYDPNVLQLLSVKNTNLLGSYIDRGTYESPYPLAWLNIGAMSDYTEDGAIATLVFGVKRGVATQTTSIELTCEEAYNKNLTEYALACVGGSIEIVNKHTVTFESNGGTTVPNQTVSIGHTVPVPATVTKEGHTFIGWYADAACTVLWDFEHDTVSEDMTLYAKWDTNRLTVIFETNGGSAVATQEVLYGNAIFAPVAPQKSSYAFDGWYTDAALTQPYDMTAPVTSSMTLYAKWRVQEGGGDVDGDGDVDFADALLIGLYRVDPATYANRVILNNADVNVDGEVRFDDALIIGYYVIGRGGYETLPHQE